MGCARAVGMTPGSTASSRGTREGREERRGDGGSRDGADYLFHVEEERAVERGEQGAVGEKA